MTIIVCLIAMESSLANMSTSLSFCPCCTSSILKNSHLTVKLITAVQRNSISINSNSLATILLLCEKITEIFTAIRLYVALSWSHSGHLLLSSIFQKSVRGTAKANLLPWNMNEGWKSLTAKWSDKTSKQLVWKKKNARAGWNNRKAQYVIKVSFWA